MPSYPAASPTLIVVLGPTGVGKTACCLRLAQLLQLPVINADSRQLFAEIPIGTAAPTSTEQEDVKHYFVGTHHIGDYYSASCYETDVLQLLDKHFREHSTALLSGGSMMYIDAVCNGIDDIPTINEATRSLMKHRLATEGLGPLVEELKILDPEHWAVVDKNNPRRVLHALEICHMTGKTYTSFRTNQKKQRPFCILKIGLTRPREELYTRINARVDEMIRDGLVDEAMRMLPFRNENALNTVGYKELFAYFDGTFTLEEAIERIKGNTRRYCRKQLTWFKRDDSIRWFHPDQWDNIVACISEHVVLSQKEHAHR